MSITKYRALVNVVDLQSMTAAANKMGYSQPGISHMISSLEAEFGFPLLRKERDSIVTTPEGEAVVECCRNILLQEDILHETVESFHNLASGGLNISAIHSMLLNVVPSIISEFTNFYTGLDVVIREELYEEIPLSLFRNDSDIAFTSKTPLLDSFDFIPLFEDELGIAISKQNPLFEMEQVPISTLSGYTIITGSINCDDVYEAIIAKSHFEPGKHYVVDSDVAAIAMVSTKTAVRPISKLQEPSFPQDIVFKPLKEQCTRTIGIAVNPLRKNTPIIKALIDFSKNNINRFIPV